jgi:hypothetical protein
MSNFMTICGYFSQLEAVIDTGDYTLSRIFIDRLCNLLPVTITQAIIFTVFVDTREETVATI